MRRYLAYCPEEEPRIFRMLDLISRGAQGDGPVHILLISAAGLGFALGWGGEGLGSGFSTSPENDVWSYPAFLRFYLGMPGDMVFLPSYLSGRAFLWG